MIRLSRQQRCYSFSAANAPVARVPAGATVIFETEDAGSRRITKPQDIHTYVARRDYTNPTTGPVFVEGARPGDTLAVTIERIELDDHGYTKLGPHAGILISQTQTPAVQIWRIAGDHGHYSIRWGDYALPARPMVGTIGVAPAGEPILNYAPGHHGGNLDVPAVAEGATIYLPVFVPGALFSLGDVHARQGDGEISGVALETRSVVTARLDLLADVQWERPWIETPEAWITIGISLDLRQAMEQSVGDMFALLNRTLGLPSHDALMLLGVAGDLRAGQTMLDPTTPATVYLRLPKPATI
jgi:amidase